MRLLECDESDYVKVGTLENLTFACASIELCKLFLSGK